MERERGVQHELTTKTTLLNGEEGSRPGGVGSRLSGMENFDCVKCWE